MKIFWAISSINCSFGSLLEQKQCAVGHLPHIYTPPPTCMPEYTHMYTHAVKKGSPGSPELDMPISHMDFVATEKWEDW